MKNNFNKYLSIIILLVFTLTTFSCFEDKDYESDVSKVVPTIFDLKGTTVAFVDETSQYSVTARGGSEFVWTVSGAEIQTVDGRTDIINVYFNQFEEAVSVSVYEIVANGATSETSTIDNIVVFGTPCNWTIEMQDAYGDGWNGASLSFSFDGFDGGEFSLDDGASLTQEVAVPDGSVVDISFNSGDWDEEVTFQIYDGNGTLVFEGGPTPTVGSVLSMTNSCP